MTGLSGREKCSRLAEKFKHDALDLALQDNTEGALCALENYAQLFAISILRDEETCMKVYDALLASVPELFPS